jgi:hypothetical protein
VEEFRTETLVADAEQLAALAGRPAGYRSVLLTLRRQGRDIAVGAFALVEGEQPARTLAPAYLEALAHGIYAAGDVHTVYLGQLAPDNENAGA